MYTYLSKDKGAVMLEVDLAAAQGGQRGGPTAEGALAGLLGCGVHRLPASHARGQVRAGHPAVVPNVEIPLKEESGH